jgi:hypothetical protein
LTFDRLDSGYRVGTAGTRGIGRSSTLQLFHGSEVAFWPFAETHLAGILQAVADRPGTEAVKEFMETDGELPTSIEWTANRNLPRGTFRGQSTAAAESSCNCRWGRAVGPLHC